MVSRIFSSEVFSDNHPRKFMVRGMVTLGDLLSRFKDSVKISALSKMDMDTLLVVYSDPETGEYDFSVPQGEYSILFESPGSERKVEDLNIALTHPGDSIVIPDKVLPKSDFFADMDFVKPETDRKYNAGDSAVLDLSIEPYSILLVEHFIGDSLIRIR
ncbi:MAG: hypothetical protein R2744_04770 [Bacteroidales bacterium]